LSESYIPLYRKYRQQTFNDIVDQTAVVTTLSNAIKLNKITHAYLFTGPRGTGKTSAARIFAKSLNCSEGPTVTPCGKCPNCTDLVNGTSMDIIEIDAASNNKVEDARNLLEKVNFAPISGKYRIYIIDEVHMLSTAAFNTLLKTLEEPPKNLVFILATTEPHKVLETIISRCQKFDFRRIRQTSIFEHLKKISKKENLKIKDEALSIIARNSAGGLRDALALLDQASVLGLNGKTVDESDILSILGSISEDTLLEIADILAKRDAKNLISVINKTISLGNEPLQFIRQLMQHFRNLMLVKSAGGINGVEDIINASENVAKKLNMQTEEFEIIEIAQIIEKLAEYEKTMKTTTNQYLWLEMALISICYRHEIHLIKDLEQRISALEGQLAGNTAVIGISKPVSQINFKKPEKIAPAVIQKEDPTAVITESPEEKFVKTVEKTEEDPVKPVIPEKIHNDMPKETVAKIPAENLNSNWAKLLENIESVPSRMLLNNLAKPVEVNSESIIITFNVESFVKQAQEKSKMLPLEKAAAKMFGKTPRILIRTPMPDDHSGEKKNETDNINLKPKAKTEIKQEEIYTQISQELETQKLDKTEIQPVEDDVDDEILKTETCKNFAPVNLSDQAKIVIDWFKGNIIDQV